MVAVQFGGEQLDGSVLKGNTSGIQARVVERLFSTLSVARLHLLGAYLSHSTQQAM